MLKISLQILLVNKANQYFKIFNNLNKQSLSSQLRPICKQLNKYINHSSRLQIIHFLLFIILKMILTAK